VAQAELARGDPTAAVAAIERGLAIGRDSNTARQFEADVLACLAEALAGTGRFAEAREAAERAVASGRERGTKMWECAANLALARVLLADPGVADRDRIVTALTRAQELVDATGAAKYAPFVHVERARLAERGGNETERRAALTMAARLFNEIGAAPRAERMARELGS